MFSWVKIRHLVEWTHGQASAATPLDASCKSINTDTRTLKPGDIYLALRGEQFDGNAFVEKARELGAAVVITDKKLDSKIPHIFVRDGLTALVAIGEALRSHFKGKVCGITGSAGKSSTKDMVACLLGENTVSSPASFNNLMGVSRTLFLPKDSTQNLVLEMGMNAFGEIAELCQRFRPEMGLITNIGDAHVGKLGGPEGVYRAKKEMFDYLAGVSGSAIALNVEDPMVVKAYESVAKKVKKITYAADKRDADISIDEKSLDPHTGFLNLKVTYFGQRSEASLPVFGMHHAQNFAAALALGTLMGKDWRALERSFARIRPASHRGEVTPLAHGISLIDECYNSNPSALYSSLESLSRLDSTRRRVLVLGEMRELGEFSQKLHYESGVRFAGLVKKSPHPFVLLLVGPEMKAFAEAVKEALPNALVENVENVREAQSILENSLQPKDVLFVKGSRGVKLDSLLPGLLTKYAVPGQ